MFFRKFLRRNVFQIFARRIFIQRALRFNSNQYAKPLSSPLYIPSLFSFAIANFISVVKAEGVTVSNKDNVPNSERVTKMSTAVARADELFQVGKFKESYHIILDFHDSDNVEILWRLARALYNMSKQKGVSTKKNQQYIDKAYNYVVKALKINDQHYAVHKWMAIMIDAKSSLEGMKAKISTLPLFKEHLMKAVQLNPRDATSMYMLGQYMYNIADMSWLQRSLAKTLFGTPPEATFEEALYYFNKAEEVDPNFYSANLLMLGKTCLKLKRIETGRFWLKCAISYPVRTDEDEAVRLEADELLKKYPAVKGDGKVPRGRNLH